MVSAFQKSTERSAEQVNNLTTALYEERKQRLEAEKTLSTAIEKERKDREEAIAKLQNSHDYKVMYEELLRKYEDIKSKTSVLTMKNAEENTDETALESKEFWKTLHEVEELHKGFEDVVDGKGDKMRFLNERNPNLRARLRDAYAEIADLNKKLKDLKLKNAAYSEKNASLRNDNMQLRHNLKVASLRKGRLPRN